MRTKSRKHMMQSIRWMMIFLMVIPQWAMSYQVQLERHIMARQGGKVLEAFGILAPGAVVKVPRILEQAGEDDFEKQLMDWLAQSGELREFNLRGQVKKDYFLPVEVVDPAGSKDVKAGDIAYVSIRFLVRRQGLSLVVTEEAPVVEAPPLEEKKQAQQTIKALEKIKKSLRGTLSRVDQWTNRNLKNRKGPHTGIRRLSKNCPFSYSEFELEVGAASEMQQIPAELLFAVMQVESAGNCFSRRREIDGSFSVGLFQVNTKTSRVPVCNAIQLSDIRNAEHIEDLHQAGLHCLDNPVVNIKEAALILRAKYAQVNSQAQPATGRWFDFAKEERDSWRKALAAYNGGQAYVYEAYRDIRSFNRKHGTELNPDSWEHRRTFFFRRWIDREIQRESFDRTARFRRPLEQTLLNISYVETIAGREDAPQKVSLVQKWAKELYAQQVAQVSNRGSIEL